MQCCASGWRRRQRPPRDLSNDWLRRQRHPPGPGGSQRRCLNMAARTRPERPAADLDAGFGQRRPQCALRRLPAILPEHGSARAAAEWEAPGIRHRRRGRGAQDLWRAGRFDRKDSRDGGGDDSEVLRSANRVEFSGGAWHPSPIRSEERVARRRVVGYSPSALWLTADAWRNTLKEPHR